MDYTAKNRISKTNEIDPKKCKTFRLLSYCHFQQQN